MCAGPALPTNPQGIQIQLHMRAFHLTTPIRFPAHSTAQTSTKFVGVTQLRHNVKAGTTFGAMKWRSNRQQGCPPNHPHTYSHTMCATPLPR